MIRIFKEQNIVRPLQRALLAALVVAPSLAVDGCGFEPMLAAPTDQSSVAGDFSKVRVATIEGRSGQVLRNDLINFLTPRGEPDQPQYTLLIRIEEPLQNLAFQRNNSVTNVNYNMRALWSLVDDHGATIASSVATSSQQYAQSNSQYATAISAQNTRDQVAMDISQSIRNALAQFFIQRTAAAPKKETTTSGSSARN